MVDGEASAWSASLIDFEWSKPVVFDWFRFSWECQSLKVKQIFQCSREHVHMLWFLMHRRFCIKISCTLSDKISSDKIFDTKPKFRQFCPKNFCPTRYLKLPSYRWFYRTLLRYRRHFSWNYYFIIDVAAIPNTEQNLHKLPSYSLLKASYLAL